MSIVVHVQIDRHQLRGFVSSMQFSNIWKNIEYIYFLNNASSTMNNIHHWLQFDAAQGNSVQLDANSHGSLQLSTTQCNVKIVAYIYVSDSASSTMNTVRVLQWISKTQYSLMQLDAIPYSSMQMNTAQYSSILINLIWKIIEYAYVLSSASSKMEIQKLITDRCSLVHFCAANCRWI